MEVWKKPRSTLKRNLFVKRGKKDEGRLSKDRTVFIC